MNGFDMSWTGTKRIAATGICWLMAGCLGATAFGQTPALKTLEIGAQAPEWKDLGGVDDQRHSLAEVREAVVVLVFTCNSCPYAVDVEERLVALQQKYAQANVRLVAICSNKIEADRIEAMKTRAEERGFKFWYLHDETQEVAKAYGATTTPEFFVLDASRKLTYHGSLDDSPDGKQVTKRYVEQAVDALLNGTKIDVQDTKPVGCRIRYERARR